MAVTDLNPAATPAPSGYVKPNYSSGDKAAAVFGNSWGMDNKRNEAAYKNAQNFMRDTPLLQKQGYLKAGINPLIAMSGGASFNSAPNTSNYHKDHSIMDTLKDLFGIVSSVLVGNAMNNKYSK